MKKIVTLGIGLAFCLNLSANEFVVDTSSLAKGGASGTVLVGFAGNGNISDSQIDLSYDPSMVSVQVKALSGATCVNHADKGLIQVISPDTGGKMLSEKVSPYCQVSMKALKGALSKKALNFANAVCGGATGSQIECGSSETMTNLK